MTVKDAALQTSVVLDAFAAPVSVLGKTGQDASELMQEGAATIRTTVQAAEDIAKAAKPGVEALKRLVAKAEQKGVVKRRPRYEPQFAPRKNVGGGGSDDGVEERVKESVKRSEAKRSESKRSEAK